MPEETHEEITARILAETTAVTAKTIADAATAAAIVLAKENIPFHTAIAVLQTEMSIFKEHQACFETEMNHKLDNLSPKFEKIFAKLDDIALGRPTWATALIIGGLLSLCVGLIVLIVSHGGVL